MKTTAEWFKAALIRMVKTAAQTALSLMTIGQMVSDIDWKTVLSVSIVAAVYSFLTSIVTGLPEVGSDGTVQIESTGNVSGIDIDLNGEDIIKKKLVKLRVNELEEPEENTYQGKH